MVLHYACCTVQVRLRIRSKSVPLLNGVEHVVARGVRSTAHNNNLLQLISRLTNEDFAGNLPQLPALLDPQTSGVGKRCEHTLVQCATGLQHALHAAYVGSVPASCMCVHFATSSS
jgi:hypothetical protein